MTRAHLIAFLEYQHSKDQVNVLPPDAAQFLRAEGLEPHDYGFLVMGEDKVPEDVANILVCSQHPTDRPAETRGQCAECEGPAYHSSGVSIPNVRLICAPCYMRRGAERPTRQ